MRLFATIAAFALAQDDSGKLNYLKKILMNKIKKKFMKKISIFHKKR